MSSKIVVIISTGEKEKAFTAIMYATNAQKNKWLDEVKVVFFGPFENLICQDEEVADFASQLLDFETPVACKRLSDEAGISDKLKSLGYDVEYVGSIISELIKQGYAPMVF
ncbi:MAG: hypothetical protein JRH18_10740 [Deltaproteobacteria bacterium]|nr:hypothetical protein [Deltaproteobacteria bacterium]MBW1993819.1 hypothetical protein [Deltaproteobacteria bacterium]MBW2152132.1 hypothetical protein [Deltaproteobacteria bacterium]